MYLHIGQDWMVPMPDVIGIFQERLLDESVDFHHLFLRLTSEGRVRGDRYDAKSVVLTDENLYLTAISAHTLMRRAERRDSPFESV
ncbi:extracellular matrix regulator RemB [Sulfobacillus harzensis]|uniref:DUF370 domain-containing protein n=1 Tax=Sulfobacillus harzensis TaxID=2729629 RepID=A0A7Y0Q0Y8_9FIRM|nr:DUF370 domain-containing protein [Sulfobacillus harzensis]NMP20912.1 DUF370 domain-containing protein [Sulfobacillus harzensis]